MQVGRLFEIVYLLLNRENITARELAERFEVSTRTVYRDIDALSASGIPVYSAKGRGGGIRLMPGFVLDRSLLSAQEQQGILAALQSLHAVGADAASGDALQKISGLFQHREAPWISIDFAGWEGRNDVFEALKSAILKKEAICFDYYGSNGTRTSREAEPLQLSFKGRTWYLLAYCTQREGLRMFKLSRIRGLHSTGRVFTRTLTPENSASKTPAAPEYTKYKLKISAALAFRVYDEFPPENICPNKDGGFIVTAAFPFDAWALGYFLSFGRHLEVLEPPFVRELLRKEAAAAAEINNSF